MSCEIWIKFTFNDLMTLKSGSICVFVKGLELTVLFIVLIIYLINHHFVYKTSENRSSQFPRSHQID